MKDRKKPEKFLPPHGMPSDGCEFAFSSRVPPKALTIKIPYTSWNYQYFSLVEKHLISAPYNGCSPLDIGQSVDFEGGFEKRDDHIGSPLFFMSLLYLLYSLASIQNW